MTLNTSLGIILIEPALVCVHPHCMAHTPALNPTASPAPPARRSLGAG
jgi:hypothetical protein